MLFVTVASQATGYGHLNRCLSLVSHIPEEKASSGFLLFGTEVAKQRVEAAGLSCHLLPEAALAESKIPLEFPRQIQAEVVIVDLLHAKFFADTAAPASLFQGLRSLGRRLVVIDVLGDDAIARRMPEVDVDILVTPYVAPVVEVASPRWQYLHGAEYALLSAEYACLPLRVQRKHANRILISCGGSDANGNTLQALRALERIAAQLEVRIVVGPLFDKTLRSELNLLVAGSHHDVRLIEAPGSLLAQMLWCDLAICASGLTKYELAASATPALLFSIDALHDSFNRPFAATGAALDIGIGIEAERLSKAVDHLLGDVTARSRMAAIGKALVDGRGAQRLFKEITKEHHLAE